MVDPKEVEFPVRVLFRAKVPPDSVAAARRGPAAVAFAGRRTRSTGAALVRAYWPRPPDRLM